MSVDHIDATLDQFINRHHIAMTMRSLKYTLNYTSKRLSYSIDSLAFLIALAYNCSTLIALFASIVTGVALYSMVNFTYGGTYTGTAGFERFAECSITNTFWLKILIPSSFLLVISNLITLSTLLYERSLFTLVRWIYIPAGIILALFCDAAPALIGTFIKDDQPEAMHRFFAALDTTKSWSYVSQMIIALWMILHGALGTYIHELMDSKPSDPSPRLTPPQ